MANGYSPDDANHPITVGWWSTEHVAGALVIGALILLILIGRGFRGVSAGGVSVGVR
jgi:hypothetical protein